MSHQDGFSNNGTEPTGSSKPDDDDDGMQKKDENVAHAQDGIKLNKLKNSGRLQNSPPTRVSRTASWRRFKAGYVGRPEILSRDVGGNDTDRYAIFSVSVVTRVAPTRDVDFEDRHMFVREDRKMIGCL